MNILILFMCMILLHIFFVRICKFNQFKMLKFTTILFIFYQISLITNNNIGDIFFNIILIILFQYNYFHLINLRETGRRARLLVEISTNKYSINDLNHSYTVDELIINRVDRLVDANRIYIDSNHEIHIKNQGILWANHILVFMKKIFYGVPKLD